MEMKLSISKNLYRAGLIGCGRIGADYGSLGSSRIASHAQAYVEHPKVELVAACELNEQALKQCGQRWEVNGLYSDLHLMLDVENADILSISSPPQTHLPLLKEIVKHADVRGVLIEKPLASSLEESNAILELLSGTNIKVAVNYIRRFPQRYRQAVQRIKMGALGEIQHVQVYYTKGVLNNASHAIDLLRSIFGDVDEFVVSGPVLTSYSELTMSFSIKFSSGIQASFVALDYRQFNLFEIDILGSKERLIFRDQGHILESFPIVDTRLQHGFRQLDKNSVSQSTELSRAIFFAVDDLIGAIENDRQPACTLEDGFKALELALGIVEQAKMEMM